MANWESEGRAVLVSQSEAGTGQALTNERPVTAEVSVANDVSRVTIWSPVVRGDYHGVHVYTALSDNTGPALEAPLIDNHGRDIKGISG